MGSDVFVLLIVVAICSYFSVKVWVNAQQAEREAYYRSEAIKKIAEFQGTVPEPVLEVLREALVPKPPPPNAINYDYNREREAFYRSETAKKIAESAGGGAAAIEFLRQEERKLLRRRVEGFQLGGAITLATGIALMIFMRSAPSTREFYLTGLMPAFIGLSLLIYTFTMPKE
jgi:hypothetical protein